MSETNTKDRAALSVMATTVIRDAMTDRCELVADKADQRDTDDGGYTHLNDTRCPHPVVAVRVEHGFTDLVCEKHAHSAERRGTVVAWSDARRG